MITKYMLMQALFNGGPLTTPEHKIQGVCSVEREDGSGHCFNVKGYINGECSTRTVFIRTVD